MATTTKRLLPYPALSDAPNPPSDITALVNVLEAEYGDAITPANNGSTVLNGSTRYYKQGRWVVLQLNSQRAVSDVSSGTTTFFTLPTGYRPTVNATLVAINSGSGSPVHRVVINTNGTVTTGFTAGSPWTVGNTVSGCVVFLAA